MASSFLIDVVESVVEAVVVVVLEVVVVDFLNQEKVDESAKSHSLWATSGLNKYSICQPRWYMLFSDIKGINNGEKSPDIVAVLLGLFSRSSSRILASLNSRNMTGILSVQGDDIPEILSTFVSDSVSTIMTAL